MPPGGASWSGRSAWPRVAAGADGLIVEVHPDPAAALSDGPQALTTDEFPGFAADVLALADALRPVPQLAAA